MLNSRLSFAIDTGAVDLAKANRIAVFRPRATHDLSGLVKDRVEIIQGFYPDYAHFVGLGYQAVVEPGDKYDAAVVFLPRAKPLTHAIVAQALDVTRGGPIVIDGQKTDGIDSIIKACRKRGATLGEVVAKSHGKIFALSGGDFSDWKRAVPDKIEEGFVTAPGVFSADGIDKGSRALVAALPGNLKGRVADLGAGWGYLSRHVLLQDRVESCHLIEAEYDALQCARINVADSRARFHWGNALTFDAISSIDHIVMNPPFHTTRTADVDIGRGFISASTRLLSPRGTLWLVANRHLPYEQKLQLSFHDVDEVAGDKLFKVFRAFKPRVTKQ